MILKFSDDGEARVEASITLVEVKDYPMWAGRAIMAHIEHRPVETVADALHSMVARNSAGVLT